MKIIIPTYPSHFELNKKFIETAKTYVTDFNSVSIYFIVDKNQYVDELDSITSDLIKVVTIQFVLQELGLPTQLPTNKYSRQSMKKIFAAKLLGSDDQVLILDSEAQFIKPCSWKEIFQNWNSHKNIWVSQQDKNNKFLQDINDHSRSFTDPGLKASYPSDKWIFEYQNWFYEPQILQDFLQEVQRKCGKHLYYKLLENHNVFDMIGYWWFIQQNSQQYPEYQILSVDTCLQQFLSPSHLQKYLDTYIGQPNGIIEHLLHGLTVDNFAEINNIVNHYELNFIRYSDSYAQRNPRLTKQFINENPSLKLLVCSTW